MVLRGCMYGESYEVTEMSKTRLFTLSAWVNHAFQSLDLESQSAK